MAALIGGWLALRALMERGPTVTVSFSTAEGLEPDKTRVKFRSVDLGRVTAVAFSADRSRVVATLELTKQAEPFLVADTRFWVVRPRVTGTQVSGLGTLLSGAYIGMDAGTAATSRREFTGLDVPPIVTVDLPGRHFLLRADDLGSVDVGAPVYFRRVQVGSVVAYELDPEGAGVRLRVFVNAPHDRHVRHDTRFWQASGFDVALDASGIRLSTESVAAVLLGGIAFQAPADSAASEAAPENTVFPLYPDRGKALRLPDTAEETRVLHFGESVRGLSPGAPVDFRGVVVGEVAAIGVDFDAASGDVRVPVEVRLYPERLRGKGARAGAVGIIDRLVARGMRAQLRNGSLLTGQLFVALDFFPNEPGPPAARPGEAVGIPTVPGSLETLQTTLLAVARKLESLPVEPLLGDARKTLQRLERTLAAAEATVQRVDADIVPELGRTLAALRDTLAGAERTLAGAQASLAGVDRLVAEDAPMQRDLRETLREITRAAESLRNLADYLERNPGAILRGRNDAPPR